MGGTGFTLAEIAERVGGAVVGDGTRRVTGLAAPEDAVADALCAVWQSTVIESLPPGTPLLAAPGSIPGGRDGVEVRDPRAALPKLLPLFAEEKRFAPGVHPSAVVDASAVVDPAASVGALCYVGPGARIAAGAVLEAQVHAGDRVTVGTGSRIEPLVVLYDDTTVGANVLIHGGTVIGCDGFGFVPDGQGGHTKIPQVGRVVIEDDVEIGAMCTVDRATLGETRIGRGTKIDDHVHVGHNCRLGANCLLVAFTGLAGSTVLGDGAVMASRTGTVPHAVIGKGSIIGGMAGVTTDVPDGAFWSGFPAQEHRKELKQQALLRKLPELFERVKKLERE